MPWSRPHPCAERGCPELTHTRYCGQHARPREQWADHRVNSYQRGYGSAAYKTFRTTVLERDPICTECWSAPAAVPHHIDHDQTNNDPANGRGLCRDCHERHHGRKH